MMPLAGAVTLLMVLLMVADTEHGRRGNSRPVLAC